MNIYKMLIKKIAEDKSKYLTLLIFLSFLGVSFLLNFSTDNIFDPDSFYHIRHAWLYRVDGIFDSSLPWVQFSAINKMGADLWYGFHILLIPFTYGDLGMGIKFSGVTITFITLVSVFYALKNLNVHYSFFWTLGFLFSTPVLLFRLVMTRPHPLSLGLTALIFSYFHKGSPYLLGLFSFFLSWIHSSYSWLPLIAIGPMVLFRWLNRQDIEFKKIFYLGGGLLTGLLARPNPIENLELIYIQIVDVYLRKNDALAEMIGAELRNPTSKNLKDTLFIIAIFSIGLILMGIFIRRKNNFSIKYKILYLSSLIMTVFSVLLYVTSKRAIDLLALFAVIFTSSALSYLWENYPFNKHRRTILALASLTLLLIMALYSINIVTPQYKNYTLLKTKFKEPAQWLEKNTRKGDIIFHVGWDQFPPLFYWNQHNYYITGMDPVFLLKYDEELHWKMYYIAAKDMAGFTCGKKICGPEDIDSVANVIKNDFRASYVFVRRVQETRFIEYLESDTTNFKKVYDVGNSIIYKVL